MIAVIFGPPGSGKGTQAAFIAKSLQIPHVSTGAMFRAEVADGSALGRELGPILDAGELVPDELTIRILEARLEHADATHGALLDGFPRTLPQAHALDDMLHRHTHAVDIVLNLIVDGDELLHRILRRGEIDHRSDDNAEAFANRMDVYRQQTAPILGYYRGRGVRVEDIDGVGTVEQVTQRILASVGANV